MKKILMTLVILTAAIGLFSGCSTETRWAETSALVDSFCGGSIYVEGSKKTEPMKLGVYFETSGDNVDLYFVDIDSYEPGTTFEPTKKSKKNKNDEEQDEKTEGAAEGEQPEEVEFTTVSINKTELEDGMLYEETQSSYPMAEMFAKVYEAITESSGAKCELKANDYTICTRLGGAYSCTANLVCDKTGVSVNYIFKPFDEECPDATLIMNELGGKYTPIVEEPKKDEKKDDKKKDDNKKKDDKKKDDKPVNPPVNNGGDFDTDFQ